MLTTATSPNPPTNPATTGAGPQPPNRPTANPPRGRWGRRSSCRACRPAGPPGRASASQAWSGSPTRVEGGGQVAGVTDKACCGIGARGTGAGVLPVNLPLILTQVAPPPASPCTSASCARRLTPPTSQNRPARWQRSQSRPAGSQGPEGCQAASRGIQRPACSMPTALAQRADPMPPACLPGPDTSTSQRCGSAHPFVPGAAAAHAAPRQGQPDVYHGPLNCGIVTAGRMWGRAGVCWAVHECVSGGRGGCTTRGQRTQHWIIQPA